MVHHRIKGIHRTRKKRANGALIQFHYAWRGGPRFWSSDDACREGSTAYWQAFHNTMKEDRPSKGTFREILADYLASPEFNRLAHVSQKGIRSSIGRHNGIDARFGDAPIAVFDRSEIRGIAYKWRDSFKPRQADTLMAHLSAILSWAKERGRLRFQHILGFSHVYKANRSEIIWTDDEIAILEKLAPSYVSRIILAATETGLRPLDLARLSRGNIQSTPKGRRILVRTNKRGRFASIPVTPRMAALIDATPRDQLLFLTTKSGQPWAGPGNMGRAVAKWRDRCGLRPDLHLHDARGTAATRLFHANASLREIALAMGWSPQHTAHMIDVYVHINPDVSDDTLILLERAKAETAL